MKLSFNHSSETLTGALCLDENKYDDVIETLLLSYDLNLNNIKVEKMSKTDVNNYMKQISELTLHHVDDIHEISDSKEFQYKSSILLGFQALTKITKMHVHVNNLF